MFCPNRFGLKIFNKLISKLFSRAVFSREVWHGLNATYFTMLSVVDNQILRYIIKAQAKTPTKFSFLETSAPPLPYIVASRRMIYLKYILKRDTNEFLRRDYTAQKENP